MAIVPVNTGTTADDGTGETLRSAFEKVNAGLLELESSISAIDATSVIESVAGGAGFVSVSGAVSLDLANARAFHHTMVGNITSLSFTNVPSASEFSASWTWVLEVDATGGYALSGTPTVTWIDGASFANLDFTANAVNIVTFWQIGTTTYAALITNGTLELDDLMFSFQADGTIKVVIRQPCTLDVANDEVDGAGTVSYEKNGVTITTATAFAAGDTFEITATAGQSVSVPRYTT